MSTLMIIAYELRHDAKLKDYSKLAAGLSSLGATRLFLSSWALWSDQTPAELVHAIAPCLDGHADRLIVAEVSAYADINTPAPSRPV